MFKIGFTHASEIEALSWLNGTLATNIISIMALLVAIGAGVVAWLVWRNTSRHNANEHVHKLFSEYLRIRLDHRNTDAGVEGKNEITDIAGMKLYILEEMYNWVFLQINLQQKLAFLQRNIIKESISDNIESWRRTILVHIMQDFERTKQSIMDYACCYSVNFIKFVAFETNDQDLVNLASIHDMALKNRQRRPLGKEEKILLLAVAADSSGIKT